MASWNYTEWYSRRPIWLQVLLLPLLVPVTLVYGTVAMAFFLAIVLPFDQRVGGEPALLAEPA